MLKLYKEQKYCIEISYRVTQKKQNPQIFE